MGEDRGRRRRGEKLSIEGVGGGGKEEEEGIEGGGEDAERGKNIEGGGGRMVGGCSKKF